jgi:hypothetical protein
MMIVLLRFDLYCMFIEEIKMKCVSVHIQSSPTVPVVDIIIVRRSVCGGNNNISTKQELLLSVSSKNETKLGYC